MATELFEAIENFFTKREPVTVISDFKDIYMAVKFLSLHPASFFEAAEANRLSTKIPNWATSCYLFHTIPKGRQPRINYPKKDSEKLWPKELIEAVCNHFHCKEHHANQIIGILNKQDPSIIESLGVEVKKSGSDNRKVSEQKRPKGSRSKI